MAEDLAKDLVLVSLDRVNFLRKRMEEAVKWIDDSRPEAARGVLKRTLEDTDVGKMKVWQSGENPF